MTRRLRVAVIGRTGMLLSAGRRIAADGHTIGLVATCRASGHEVTREDDFRGWAREVGAPFVDKTRLDSPEVLPLVEQADCDMAISMNWFSLIPESVRARFRYGVFNAHPGDLPRFKGNACPNWAILSGEPSVALSIHRMDDALDAGPIVSKAHFPLSETTTMSQVYGWLQAAVPEGFAALVDAISQDRLTLQPQDPDPGAGLRCYPRRPEDGRIDWARPADEVSRLVRASGRPFDGAFTFLLGHRRLTVWAGAVIRAEEPFVAVPGQVAFARQGDPVICCGADYLRLTEVTLDGQPHPEGAKAAVLASLRNRLI